MDQAAIQKRIGELSPWYHSIRLGDGLVTPGRDYQYLWDPVRRVMDAIDYSGKDVLDLGSWDGMWAFEAEGRGAGRVVATDTRLQGAENLLFCKQVLGSRVLPLFNAQVQDLPNRLKIVGLDPTFDIVQHLGLFYHLRDPVLSLTRARSVMRSGGLLLLETAAVLDDHRPIMYFSGVEGSYHWGGASDTWAPTRKCLEYLLSRSRFTPVMQALWQETRVNAYTSKDGFLLGRLCAVAQAVGDESMHRVEREKLEGNQ